MLGPGARVGDWVIEEQIGVGAMGAVYRAHSCLAESLKVAVKILRHDAQPEDRGRFLREIDTLARLEHRAIVRILGSGEDEVQGLTYLVMELLEGESLSNRMFRTRVELRTAVRWFHRLALGLHHAHEQGIAHRDVKPSNIMLLDSGEVRLVDFGIAVIDDGPPITETGVVVGTFSYLAPEAFIEASPDLARSDQYSLAQVLSEVLSGENAFPRPSDVEDGRWMALLSHQKSSSAGLDPGDHVPSGLRAVIRRATQRDPTQRFESLMEFAESLAQVSLLAPEDSGPRTSASSHGGASSQGTTSVVRSASTQRASRKVVILAGLSGFGLSMALGGIVLALQGPERARTRFLSPRPPSDWRDVGADAPDPVELSGAITVETLEDLPRYEMVQVDPGSFELGCTASQYGCDDDEQPVTLVDLSQPMMVGKTEVTQALWAEVMQSQPSEFSECGERCPVEGVSWCDALIFANAMSVVHGAALVYRLPEAMLPGLSRSACDALAGEVQADLSLDGFRLPTEAEWEYIARAGKDIRFAGGKDADGVAWMALNARETPHPVGQKIPNDWDIYDLSGNVWEWVWDEYSAYSGGRVSDRVAAPESGPWRVLRGGSWRTMDGDVRVASRERASPGQRDASIGIRLVRTTK